MGILEYPLFPTQMRIMQSQADRLLMLCGRGVGKTVVASHWASRQINQDPARGLLIAPVYSQTHELLDNLVSLLVEMGVEYVFNKQPPASWGGTLTSYNSILTCRVPGDDRLRFVYVGTGDNFEAVRSKSIGWAILDEAALMKPEVHTKVILPALRGQGQDYQYRLLFLTSPRGVGNWVSELAGDDGVEMYSAPSWENFIEYPEEKIRWFRQQMGDLEFQQEIEGKIVSAGEGAIIYAATADSFKVVKRPERGTQIYLSLDQNVAPMTGLVAFYKPQRLHIMGEVIITTSANVHDFATLTLKRLGQMGVGPNEPLILCGDSSGNARNVVSHQTFYKAFLEDMRKAGRRIQDQTLRSNPSVFESAEKVNAWLRNGWMTVDPGCKTLSLDFQKGRYKPDMSTDKVHHDPHGTDCARYMVHRLTSTPVGARNLGLGR